MTLSTRSGLPRGVRLRPWRAGDDRALAQVLPDPGSPVQLAARALLREPGDSPVLRTVVAEVGAGGTAPGGRAGDVAGRATADAAAGAVGAGDLSDAGPAAPTVVVGAAAIAESPAHPQRAWVYVEVAPEERGRGLGRALLEAVIDQAAGTALAGLGLRTRVVAGDGTGEAFARAVGFSELFSTRIVRIEAGALGLAGADSMADMQVIDTGSVALTKAFAAWYEQVNALDPAAEMTLGQVNTRFLSEAAGARGAVLWRPAAADDPAGEQDINARPVTAFAVSFAQEQHDGSGAEAAGAEGAGADGVGGPAGGGAAGMRHPDAFADLSLGEEGASPALGARGGEDATELTAGSLSAAGSDLRALLARLSVETSLVLEVTSQMETESAIVDELLDAGSAKVLAEYSTLVRG